MQDALLDAHAEGLEQADAGAGFVALEAWLRLAMSGRSARPSMPGGGLKQAIFEGGLTVFAKANGLRGGLVLLRKTVIDQADGGSAGHRLIRPRAGFEDGRHVPATSADARIATASRRSDSSGLGWPRLGSRDAAFNPSEARLTLPRLPRAASRSRGT